MLLPTYPGPRLEMAVERAASSLVSLVEAARGLLAAQPEAEVRAAAARGWFRPLEEEALIFWFARFLTVRDGLWEVLSELIGARDGEVDAFFELEPATLVDLPAGDEESIDPGASEIREEWRAFVLGYSAACGIVHLDRCLLERLAVDSVTQRKLNEGVEALRIPRKRFTWIFESSTEPLTALMLDRAIQTRRRVGRALENATADPLLAPLLPELPWLESSLDRSRRRFVRRFLRFQAHALRRRFATLRDHGFFSAAESSGLVVAEIRDRWKPKQVSEEVMAEIDTLLQPGDVLVTRHEWALTNLFLPGFWPHAALYVGTEADRRRMGIEIEQRCEGLWAGPCRVLEALKDGVRFRPLEETLSVDAVAVIRPKLEPASIAEGLSRAAAHEGKGYNFDFDFFRSDRLVCTEVIYRAYDGLENLELPLKDRAGRPTLAAEDLLDLAFDTGHFEVVAVFGAPSEPTALWVGEAAVEPLRRSYRPPVARD